MQAGKWCLVFLAASQCSFSDLLEESSVAGAAHTPRGGAGLIPALLN